MNNEHYKNIIKNAPIGYAFFKLVLDERGAPCDFEFLEVNRAYEELTGLKAENIINKRITQVLPTINKGNLDWLSLYSEVAINGGKKEFERYSDIFGAWYKVQVYSYEKGFFTAIFIDITSEKKKTMELEGFFNVNLDLLCIADTEGNFIKLNREWESVLGYCVEDLQKRKFLDFIHPQDLPATLEAISKLSAQEQVLNFVNRYRCKDGSYKFIEWRSHPRGNLIYAAARDITDRKSTEAELRNIKEQYELAIAGTNDGIWDWDIRTNYLFLSKRWKEMLGYEDHELKNEFNTFISLVYEEDLERLNDYVQKYLSGKIEKYTIEFRMKHKDGSIRWIMAKGEAMRDAGGKPWRMAGSHSDITQRKSYEDALIVAKETAEIASRAKSEFLANMSHEIRTPLNGVIGFTELLMQTPLNEIQMQYAGNANVSGQALLGIINDILDFSKIEAGRLELEIIKTNIIELAEQAADIIKFHAAEKGLELLLDIDPDMPETAEVDPVRLKQILVNLLNNAVKFTENGEVELKVRFEAAAEKNAGIYHFSVRDTGIGISEEQRLKLFKAFSQADSSTTRKFGGTGLGLIISNLLANKMGGKIEIDSEYGRGSAFHFSIETKCEKTERADGKIRTAVKRALVLDDNERNRTILQKNVESFAIKCAVCGDGLSALKMIEDSSFDLLIADCRMPYLSGLETVTMLREKLNIAPEKMPVIMLHDSFDDKTVLQECKKAGVKFNLIKPVKANQLIDALNNIHKKEIPESESKKIENESGKTLITGRPKTVLIAEDVKMNMLLIKTIIKQMVPGCHIVEAVNGKETVELAENKKPDLILMDIQMPELDGIEAAGLIRESENGSGRRVPILALTASATKDEKEKCLAAGMDDFITKPIEPHSLREKLEKYLDCKSGPAESREKYVSESVPRFDKESLMAKSGNDITLFKEFVRVSFSDTVNFVKALGKFIDEKNEAEMKKTVHSLKGLALTFGYNRIAQLTVEVEKNIDAGFDIILKIYEEMKLELNALEEILKNEK
ncbi:MAG: Signal transduction histidine-protein kinase BarA [bacterium ADurb.Bin243]|nr:MAG: Signal transduction histidine-protein kinase BarA [bacterium ADurb.Bin243]